MAKKSNPFDSIAKKNGTAGKKAASKIAASVTTKIKKTVDTIINHKAKIKQIKAELDIAEQTVIEHVQPQQEAQARSGNYSKSFYVEGEKGSLTYTTQDKFTIAKDEEVHNAIENLLGKDFDNFVQYKRTITLLPKVQDNAALINKIVKAITDAGIDLEEAFEVKDVLVTQPDVDKKQYELPASKLTEFQTLVKQYKPALK